MALEDAIFEVLKNVNDDGKLMNKVVATILKDQQRVLEGIIHQYGYGPKSEEAQTLAAIKEVIDYNSIIQQD